MTGKVSNLLVRTLTGAVLLAVVVFAVLFSQVSMLALLLLIGIGSLAEFYRLARRAGVRPNAWLGCGAAAAGIVLCFAAASGWMEWRWAALSVPLAVFPTVAQLWRRTPSALSDVSVTLGGMLYTALPMVLLGLVAYERGIYEPWLVLAVIFTVWINDIFAYLTGMLLGRHKLFQRISPKKTWEGFAGGAVCAVAFAAFAGWGLAREPLVWAGLGLVTALSSVAGDLVESMFKRAVSVKDSGSVMPGHGGFLDRFDALLYCMPFVYAYFVVFRP